VTRKTDLERYEETAAWHAETLPLLREALGNLTTVHSTCPSTVETKTLASAIKAARAAVKECERNLAVSRRLVAREQHRAGNDA
jgi:hypothetical protein